MLNSLIVGSGLLWIAIAVFGLLETIASDLAKMPSLPIDISVDEPCHQIWPDVAELTLKELRACARGRIPGFMKLKKAELQRVLQAGGFSLSLGMPSGHP